VNRHVVDWPKLCEALEMACEIRGMSLRDVATEIGISPSGLTRIRQGTHLSADGLAALVAWLFPSSVPLWIKPSAGPSQQEGEDG
jgi:transcriptional regulator with XRE-family HTH domain